MSFSRRRFLSTGLTASAGATLLAPAALFAESQAAPQTVPPAIAALPKLSGQARPFTNAERAARIERAKVLMTANKMDAIILTGGTSLQYFANMRIWNSERMWALVIPAKAKPFLVVPAFEEGRARETLDVGVFGKDAEVLPWQEDESPFALVGKGLRDRGVATGTLGVEEETKFVFSDSIARANPQLTLISATAVTAGCRMIKEPHELECMRLASKATLMVYRAVAQSVHPGMTNADVEHMVSLAYRKVGFPGGASLNIDEFTALPHGSAKPQTLREGSILMLDDGCEVEGYQSDITRTFVLGKATDKQKKVFDIVKAAQTAALKTARPGVVTGDVDAAARKVIVDAGYGPGFTYFTHRVGHGIGMDGHEWPYFAKNNMFGWDLAPKLQPNMTLSDEPGIYIKGEFGVRLEDDLHVTETGAELLTPQSPSIEDPFAGMTY